MKIEKLLTLSQFVEYLYSEYEPYNKDTLLNAHKAECFDLTVNYMQFLKQPLKKVKLAEIIDTNDEIIWLSIETLNDLAVSTNGQLPLKNVEL